MDRIRFRTRVALVSCAAFVLTGALTYGGPIDTSAALASLDRAIPGPHGETALTAPVAPAAVRRYGAPQAIGRGEVRTYVTVDPTDASRPLEVGVAMSERAMEGLPAPMAMSAAEMGKDGHAGMTVMLLDMPAGNPTAYRFVMFGWNSAGHEPPGVYDLPHFDFHFYTVDKDVPASILPSDPQFAAKAARFPAPELRPPYYVDAATAAKTTAAAMTVPQMGFHWLDVRSPELQGLAGHPESAKPFTRTFIYGTWDGRFIFDEPMITRAHLMSKRDATDPALRDEIIPVPTAARHAAPGYYPAAYRITWDAQAKEYRVALTRMEWKN